MFDSNLVQNNFNRESDEVVFNKYFIKIRNKVVHWRLSLY
jgi:hypothetical protein